MEARTAPDVIEALAPLLKVRPVIEDFCRFGGSWRSPHAPRGGSAQFHIVTRGACRLHRPGRDELRLEAGDVLLLPHGDNHVVRSLVDGPARTIASDLRNGLLARATEGESDTELLCGELVFEAGDANPLVGALPDIILIRTADEPLLERFRRLLVDIRDELDGDRVGSRLIAADLARALFVTMLRDHLEADDAGTATLPLLRDRVTQRAVLAMLHEPARRWTLDELAAAGFASRATLVRSFRRLTGATPMKFLGDLRLTIARQRLTGSRDSVARIAADVGYQSEGALSKAMMQRFGRRPGAFRLDPATQD